VLSPTDQGRGSCAPVGAQAAKPEQAHPEAQSPANTGLLFWVFTNHNTHV